jgi:probable phosphomutase (TIGR03848 family)
VCPTAPILGDVTTVLLIRHGRSVANVDGVLAGRSDTPLDATGVEQASGLATRLVDVPLDALVTSPQLRARPTAALAAGGRSAPRVDESFAECDYGRWSGKALKDLVEEPEWRTVQWLPSAARFPQGESMAQMAHRAVRGVRDLALANPDGFVWIVSHADVIKAVLSDALGAHLDHFQRIVIDPASISVITYTERRPFVERMNDTGSLRLARNLRTEDAHAVVGGRASQ